MLTFSQPHSFTQRIVTIVVMISLVTNVGITQQPSPTPAAEGGVSGVASRAVIKRQEQVKKADQLFTNANQLAADGMHADAMDAYLGAFDLMPNAPASAERRTAYFKRYQKSAVAHAQSLADQAEYEQAEATLKKVYATARSNGLQPSSVELSVKDLLGKLNGGHFNKAVTPQHLRNVADVEMGLKTAIGALEIGNYDLARKHYNEVLAIDRYNTAARRGLEKVEAMIMEYSEVARTQSRAAALRKIAAGWETPTPPAFRGSGTDFKYSDAVVGTNQASLETKLKRITLPSLEFQDAPLSEVMTFLSNKSRELDLEEADPAKRGVNFIIQGAPDAKDRPVNIEISNVPLEAAVKYVCQQVAMKYRVEEFAVAIIPLSSPDDSALLLRRYTVPPGFIQGAGAPAAAIDNDPFATPDTSNGGTPVKRITAEEFLKGKGVTFEDGAFAKFNDVTSQLIVRNRPDQIAIVDSMVLAARETVPKNVLIKIRMISMALDEATEHGYDVLLGQGNLGSSNRVFGGGGTFSNAGEFKTAQDFPFGRAGGPITGGLRSGDIRSLLSVDEVIARQNSTSASGNDGPAPAIFGVSGFFTDPQFDLVLRGLSQMKSTDRLCEASVLVRPGQRATIEQVREFIYPTEYDPPELPNSVGVFQVGNLLIEGDATSFPVTPANPTAFETRKLGKYIEVEPVISDDNRTINLSLLIDFSDFSGFINYGTPIGSVQAGPFGLENITLTENRILMPVFDAVKETTNVNVWDGNTIAIGGIITEDVDYVDDKVPGLGDIPVVGQVFRSKVRKPNKRGMVMFVSAQIVDPSDLPVNAPLDEATTRSTSLTPVPTPAENF